MDYDTGCGRTLREVAPLPDRYPAVTNDLQHQTPHEVKLHRKEQPKSNQPLDGLCA